MTQNKTKCATGYMCTAGSMPLSAQDDDNPMDCDEKEKDNQTTTVSDEKEKDHQTNTKEDDNQ